MEAWVVATTIVIVYSILCIGLGYVAGRVFRKTIEDFYVLSRTAGFIVLFLATASTYHSAFAFLTSVAVFAGAGISFWIAAAPWTILAAIGGYILGKRLFLVGKAKGFITPADLLADYYGSESLRLITAIVQALFVIAYIVVQAIGLGIILSIASGGRLSYEVASLVLMIVAALYVAIGGLRAAYWTDVLQGIWMYIGVWIAGILIVTKFFPGGIPQLMDAVRQTNPNLLVMTWTPDKLLSFIMVYSFGVILLPHMWIKYYAARDTWTLKWSSAAMALYVSSFYIPAALVGLTAAVLNKTGIPGVLEAGFIQKLISTYGSRDAVMAYMIYNFTPPIVAGFLLAGAAAAAMSTLDSFLGSTSMILTRDIWQRYIRPKASEKELVLISRIFILIWAFIGWYFAVLKPGLIFDITAIACSGGLQFLIPTVQALYPTKRNWINKEGAITGILVGVITTIILTFGGRIGLPIKLHPAVAGTIGLALNLITAIL
ncbi:MAG TPA: sodium:solute symporter family protein, partial [Desulfurococcaceae archaeon]|nr:sodium:solute symporter family protein [Desulfurococcaceae archaeon]